MFKFLRDVVSTTVDASAYMVKGTVKFSTNIVAGTAEIIGGENEITKGIRSVGDATSKATDFVVDKAAKPLAKAVGKGVVRKVERVYDIGAGLAEATFTDRKKEGFKRAGKGVTEMVVISITAGAFAVIAEHVAEGLISEPISNAVDAVADYIQPDDHADAAAEMAAAGGSHAISSAPVLALGGHSALESGLRFGKNFSLPADFSAAPAESKQFVLNLISELTNENKPELASSLHDAIQSGRGDEVSRLVGQVREALPTGRFLAAAQDVTFGSSLKA